LRPCIRLPTNDAMDLKTKLRNLPTKPGVYLMKDLRDRIIYVGKAKSLRARVRAYFQDSPPPDPKTSALISKIVDFDVLATDSEMEALILEANLIKKYRPRYNVNLKDDKRYPYVKVTDEPFPRVLVVRRVGKDKAHYFGPYTNVKAMRNTLKVLRRVFSIRSCNYPLPSSKRVRLCLDYHIKRCPGPCEGKISSEEYGETVKDILLFLSGKNSLLVKNLEQKMNEYSSRQEYEKAAAVRDQIHALESVTEKQKVAEVDRVDRDVLAFAREGKDIALVALQIREGILIGRQTFHLTAAPQSTDREILSTFIRQYYMHSATVPQEVILPGDIGDRAMIGDWLASKRGSGVRIIHPQRGQKVRLLDMALYNARLSLEEVLLQRSAARAEVPPAVRSLEKDLYLPLAPRSIAAFDISNLGPSNAVGSLVFFRDGRSRKSDYRRFKIRGIPGQDDFAMMRQVVGRHFRRLTEEKKPYPDLVLIDGGKGQLQAALDALKELGVTNQQVVALAKRLDEVFLPGKSDALMIPKGSASLRLLQRIRDEAHRFAVSYHRQLRKKGVTRSELDLIPGIGPAKRGVLLRRFGSVEQIKQAELQDLVRAEGLGKKAAERVYKHFHQ
jgi:excinuclease ABC subunit C